MAGARTSKANPAKQIYGDGGASAGGRPPGQSNQTDFGMVKFRAHLDARLESLRNERLSYFSHWQELGDYIVPRRYQWLITTNRGGRGSPINGKIINTTGTTAWRALASGLMAGITSPGRPWFRMTVGDPDLAQRTDVKLWCDEVTRRMLIVMADSNYYLAKATQFGDISLFGTAPMLIDADYDEVIRCHNPCAGEYFLGNSARNKVDTFYREFTYTVTQIMGRWRDSCPENIRKAAASGGGALAQEYIVCHAIEPNDPRIGDIPPTLIPANFKYRSAYWIKGSGRTEGCLEISGYHEWPVPSPRWDLVSNDAYGRSPAMDALPAIKQLQVMEKREAQAIDKHVNPPMLFDAQLKDEPASGLPGGITYVVGLGQTVGAKSMYQTNPDISAIEGKIQRVEQAIETIFFKDLFLMISQLDTVRSATEIDARREEKLIQLGPMLERFQNESLDPDIDRIFAIMQRARLLPRAPKALQGAYLKTEYVSTLSQQQQAASTAAIERLLQLIGNISALVPDAIDNVDTDEAIKEYADLIGAPPKLVRDIAVVMQLRQQKAQQAQQAQMAEQTPQFVAGAKVLSQTDLGGGQNALAAMLGAGGPPAGLGAA